MSVMAIPVESAQELIHAINKRFLDLAVGHFAPRILSLSPDAHRILSDANSPFNGNALPERYMNARIVIDRRLGGILPTTGGRMWDFPLACDKGLLSDAQIEAVALAIETAVP